MGTEVTEACQAVDAGQPSLNCIFGSGDAVPPVVLFGDLYAGMWAPAFDEYAAREGIRVRRFAGACGSILYPPDRGSTRNCDEWRSEAFAIIERERPALVVLANQSYKATRDAAEWEAGFRASIERRHRRRGS